MPPAKSLKSPRLAAVLALVPGLGHLYLGQYKKALVFFVGTGLLEFLGFDLDLTAIGAALGVPLELGAFGLYLFSIVDAYRSAQPQTP